MPKKIKKSKNPYALGFTSASTVGITLSRENYHIFIMDEGVSKKDILRWAKSTKDDDRKAVLVCQGLSTYDGMMKKVQSKLSKREISTILCDTVLNLEGRFIPIDGKKGADKAWRSERITVAMLEGLVTGKLVGLPKKKKIADLTESSIPFKVKKGTGGSRKKSGKFVAVKRATLQGLITRITKHVSARGDKLKLRNALVSIALRQKKYDGKFESKIRKTAVNLGVPKGDYADVIENLISFSDDKRLGKAHKRLGKGKTARKVVQSIEESDRTWFEGNLGYAIKVFPVDTVTVEEPKKAPKKKMTKKAKKK